MMGRLPLASIPNLVDWGLLFVWPVPHDLFGSFDPTRITLRVIGTHKPPHHFKVVYQEGSRYKSKK